MHDVLTRPHSVTTPIQPTNNLLLVSIVLKAFRTFKVHSSFAGFGEISVICSLLGYVAYAIESKKTYVCVFFQRSRYLKTAPS